MLRDYVKDEELQRFYGGLFESEARHHATYVWLACDLATESSVHERLHWLALQEAEIISEGNELPRMHS